jgi:hypothetical protein
MIHSHVLQSQQIHVLVESTPKMWEFKNIFRNKINFSGSFEMTYCNRSRSKKWNLSLAHKWNYSKFVTVFLQYSTTILCLLIKNIWTKLLITNLPIAEGNLRTRRIHIFIAWTTLNFSWERLLEIQIFVNYINKWDLKQGEWKRICISQFITALQ